MNLHGLNATSLNGGTSSSIVGAVLVVALSVATATPTRTQYPEQTTITASATAHAEGQRLILGEATIISYAGGVATWNLVTSASATTEIVSALIATPTDVYAQAGSSGAATGTIIRPGAVSALSESTSSATGLATVHFASVISSTAVCEADASVKLSGTSQWQRDGYARSSLALVVAANGLKTAMGDAVSSGLSTAEVESILVHGGAAVMASSMSASALGAIDLAIAITTCEVTAHPTVYAMAGATIPVAAVLVAIPTRTTQGAVELVAATLGVSGDGRIAIRGEVFNALYFSVWAAPRLALQGEAAITAAATGQIDPWAIRPAFANVDCVSVVTADGTRVCMGEAAIPIGVIFTADPITNPAVRAPFARTMRVPSDDRAMRVPYENRTMRVA